MLHTTNGSYKSNALFRKAAPYPEHMEGRIFVFYERKGFITHKWFFTTSHDLISHNNLAQTAA